MNISKKAIEAAARAAAIHDDYDGCFERIDEWNTQEGWERESHPDEYPASDFEDAEFWRTRARAALEAAAPMLMAQAWDEGRAHGAMWPYGYRGLGTDDNPYRKEADHEHCT